ncbi:MAG: hypothetical protein PHD21_06575 [Flavobacteriales bacterium]|nr:hypothetical protein [Flavobacteriales bacterium]
MENSLQIIDKLNKAVAVIRDHCDTLRRENRILKQEFEALKAKNESLSESLKEKEEKLILARMSNGLDQGEDNNSQKKVLKQRIQRLIKDIDKSIALLSDAKKN